ncbi:MAG: hypothetical protein FWF36_02250 [Propionibacteriaceae bacterium]|nr:hypothetical protein [Propionibacteriaceae bacterium]
MATSTWRTTYTPGSWIVLNGPRALVAAQPTSADIAERLSATWNDVVAATDLESLVGKLMRWGMDVVPDLIVVVDNDRLQCVVRGDVTVTDVASGEVVANGHGQAAWRSVNLDARHIAIALPGQNADSTWRLPLAVGVVTAGSIDIDAGDSARVGLGDAIFVVAPLAGMPVTEPAPAAPAEMAAVPETPVAVEPETAPEELQPAVPEELQAPGAWATGFGADVPLAEPVVSVTEPEHEAFGEPEPVIEPEPAPEHEAFGAPEATEPEPVVEEPEPVAEEPEAAPVVLSPETAVPAEQAAETTSEMGFPPITEAPVADQFEVVAEPVVEPVVAEAAVEPVIEPVSFAEPVSEPAAVQPEPVGEPSAAVQAAFDADLAAQIEAAKAAVDQVIAESQGVVVAEPIQVVESVPEVETPAEPVTEAAIPEPVTEVAETEPATTEQAPVEPIIDLALVEPAPEPAAEPAAQPEPAVDAQPDLDRVDWQPAQVQPMPEPAETAAPQPEVVEVPQPEVAPMPEPEPVAVPEPEPVAAPEPAPVPAVEQTGETPVGPAATGSPLGATLLVFSDGQRWPVNEPLLVGRAPQAYPGETAHLVRVVSPHHDISRTHVRIELYDGAMWATDRESTNGTTVHNPGQAVATAQPGQPMHVWVGGVIDIGDGVSIRVQ